MTRKQVRLLHGYVHKVTITKLGVPPKQDLSQYCAIVDLLGNQKAPALSTPIASGTQAKLSGDSVKGNANIISNYFLRCGMTVLTGEAWFFLPSKTWAQTACHVYRPISHSFL